MILTEFVKRKTGCLEKLDWYPHFPRNSRIDVYNNFFNFGNLTNYPLYFPHPVKQCHLDKGERNVRHFPQRANGQRKMEMPGRIRDIFHQASLRME